MSELEPPSEGLLRQVAPFRSGGERLGKIASSLWYAPATANVLELADELNRQKLAAVGVVDEEDRALGVVVRQELFGTLGKSYGRELMKKDPVSRLLSPARRFQVDENLFAVADAIERELAMEEIGYFLIVDQESRFRGIFSTRDMLVYLSDITRREMELARKIQNRIVKGYQWCRSESFELVGFSAMARGVGGDFYVFRELGPGRWFIALCDVSGKGISAALVTAMLSGMINSFDFRAGVGGFVERLNRAFNETFVQERFLTGMFLELDIPSGCLRLFDMGHSHGALYRGGRLQTLRSRAENVPIGVSQELRPQAGSLKLRKGDILLLFSDGLVDQTDERGASYPLSRLQGLLGSPESLEQLKIRLLEDFHHFRGNMHQLDDITFLLLRFNGEPING